MEQRLGLRQRWVAVRTLTEKTLLERQIAVTDTQIDRLDCDLHLPAPRASRQAGGLTEAEIKIVEDAAERKHRQKSNGR